MENMRDMATTGRVRAAQPRPTGGGVYPPGMLGDGGVDVGMQQPRMVHVDAATRISIGCQTFFFSRVEGGYLISTNQYVDWHLSAPDFEALVAGLAAMLPEKQAE